MKMSQMFKTTLAAAMIMALAVTAGCGGGGDKKSAGSEKVTLKLAHNLPTAHPLAQGMEAFNKKLTEKIQRHYYTEHLSFRTAVQR